MIDSSSASYHPISLRRPTPAARQRSLIARAAD